MRVSVRKWGNSASVRIPAAIMEAANLRLDALVDVIEVDGRIIIEPVIDAECDLDAMVAAITPDNLHEELRFGPALGKEAL
ncbi:AbrB/MazE/SpoVT family DNA-binding domain-containing protein [Polycyclovorans algicola]|uniref:AbrB/MazE/SpoVT family DNA-binding domain-containing protein n=1 Tax=Polycyclovorans algicola TaxID=616992 RepID=UPI0004A6B0B9|nr:AbrB/MazE/SpoVT family DNA-binding domain-containing protein [Polycyclovorans algicola]